MVARKLFTYVFLLYIVFRKLFNYISVSKKLGYNNLTLSTLQSKTNVCVVFFSGITNDIQFTFGVEPSLVLQYRAY